MALNIVGEALKSIKDSRGWTQDELAATLGIDQPKVSRVINGNQDLKINEASALLARVGWEVVLRPVTKNTDEKGNKPVKRRKFNANVVVTFASVTVFPSSRANPYTSPEYLQSVAHRLKSLTDVQGGLPLIPEAGRHMHQILKVTGGGSTQKGMASRVARHASAAFLDAAQPTASEHAGMTALRFAEEANDVELMADAYEALVMSAFSDDPEKAAHYARQGVKLPDLSEDMRARLNARLADALTRNKKNPAPWDARSAIAAARGATGISGVSLAVVNGSSGVALYRLGDAEEARATLSGAIHAFSGTPQPYARWLAQQAKASLSMHDLEASVHDIQSLTHVLPFVSSAKLNRDVLTILDLSAAWGNAGTLPQAREALLSVAAHSVRQSRQDR